LFRFRRTDDPSTRLAELERAHRQLARAQKETHARLEDEIETLWLLTSSP
jgi:hypothetical protein